MYPKSSALTFFTLYFYFGCPYPIWTQFHDFPMLTPKSPSLVWTLLLCSRFLDLFFDQVCSLCHFLYVCFTPANQLSLGKKQQVFHYEVIWRFYSYKNGLGADTGKYALFTYYIVDIFSYQYIIKVAQFSSWPVDSIIWVLHTLLQTFKGFSNFLTNKIVQPSFLFFVGERE